jgi:hypothetical protein
MSGISEAWVSSSDRVCKYTYSTFDQIAKCVDMSMSLFQDGNTSAALEKLSVAYMDCEQMRIALPRIKNIFNFDYIKRVNIRIDWMQLHISAMGILAEKAA